MMAQYVMSKMLSPVQENVIVTAQSRMGLKMSVNYLLIVAWQLRHTVVLHDMDIDTIWLLLPDGRSRRFSRDILGDLATRESLCICVKGGGRRTELRHPFNTTVHCTAEHSLLRQTVDRAGSPILASEMGPIMGLLPA